MKRKKLAVMAIVGLSAFCMAACNKTPGVTRVETTAEEQAALEEAQNKIIAEYAAGILMKYSSGGNSRVLDGQQLLTAEAKEKALKEQQERRQQQKEEYEAENQNKTENPEDGSSSQVGSNTGESTAAPSVTYVSDMAAPIGLSSFSITYSGYEIADTYPTAGNNMSFSVDAKAGTTFLVTKYNVTNIAGQSEELNMLSLAPSFKLRVAGKTIPAQQTMLLEDLSVYKGNVEAGQSVEGVILFEVAPDVVAAIDGIELIVTLGETDTWMLLEAGSGAVAAPVAATEGVEQVVEEAAPEGTTSEAGVQPEENPGSDIPAEESVEESGTPTVTTVGSNNNVTVEPAN